MTSTPDFHFRQMQAQIAWRNKNISTPEWGYQNGRKYEHIVPKNQWEETLWSFIRMPLHNYLKDEEIHSHTGTHNLLSSWVLCANLYFSVKIEPVFKQLMLGFLRKHISTDIVSITDAHLEFALDSPLNPEQLLGEQDGLRGSGQTSPDVAFEVKTKNGEGLILTECKYTEHSFYPCSARRTTDRDDKPANPDPSRCMNTASNYDYKSICHQSVWNRKYWDNVNLSAQGKSLLNHCPASLSGYQLFRQQSLAEGIARSNKYDLVGSSVAFDERNTTLIHCLNSTGISDFRTDWAKLFDGKAVFKTWTHKNWVDFVKQNSTDSLQADWYNYISQRYGY